MLTVSDSKIGIGHKFFLTEESYNNDEFIKTYNTIWNKKYSFIQQHKLKNKLEFPIDWTFRHPVNIKTIHNGKKIYFFNNFNEFNNLSLYMKSEFYLNIKNFSQLKFDIDGADKAFGKIQISNLNKNQKLEFRGFDKKIIDLDEGLYKISLNLHLKGDNWRFDILHKEFNDLIFTSIFNKKNIFTNLNFENKWKIKFTTFFEYYFITFLILVILKCIFQKKKNFLFFFYSILIYSFVSLLIFIFENYIKKFDAVGSFSLSIAILSIYLLFFYYEKKFFLKIRTIDFFFIIGCISIFHFSYLFFDSIKEVTWFSIGDDWEIFQVLARLIAVDEVFIYDEEQKTIRRYGFRFIVAFIHLIFGKSFFPQAIGEVWSIFLSSIIIFLILKKNINKQKQLCICASIIILCIFFGENFRWNIGRGLIEYYSLSLILFTVYFVNNTNNYNFQKLDLFKLCVLGFLIVLMREDNIFLASSLIFFMLSKIDQNEILFKNLTLLIRKNFNIILIYNTILLMALFSIFIKNYISFDQFFITQEAFHYKIELFKKFIFKNYEINYLEGIGLVYKKGILDNKSYFDDFFRLFFLTDPGKFPRITSLLVIASFIGAFIILFSKNKNIEFNFGFIIYPFFYLLSPILVLNDAYTPRYAIAYIPFAVMILFYLYNEFKEKKFKFSSLWNF